MVHPFLLVGSFCLLGLCRSMGLYCTAGHTTVVLPRLVLPRAGLHRASHSCS